MSSRDWEKRVLAAKGAEERVAEIEQEFLLASRLTALREGAGLSQRELAKRLGVSQPRVAAIERSHNLTIEVLEQYVEALGAKLEVNVVKGRRTTRLLAMNNEAAKSARPVSHTDGVRREGLAPTAGSRPRTKGFQFPGLAVE